jgi:predicted Zn-dependent protease
MRKYISLIFAGMALLLAGCGSVPVTGRKQLSLVSNQEVLTLSLQQYGEFIKSAPKSTDKVNTAMVQKVGRNIANAVENYLKNNGYADEVSSYAWEFNLVKSNDVNAFCMPGGKIVVYEGILPITQNETGLAVVLGHEVAHAVAKHANERMSQQMATQYGTAVVGAALGKASAGVQQAAATAMGLGSQYGILLPYSRKQELEADKLGLIFMAMAGYDPSAAATFWTRMSQSSGGSTPEFMSTHPSDNSRIQQIQKDLPEALKYYKGGSVSTGSAKTSNQWKF